MPPLKVRAGEPCLLQPLMGTYTLASRVKTSPRKMPSQGRSRETVDTLLEATARVLIHDGYEGTSTNKIAQKAGVSIGSLYQYFPNKESLIAGLIDRHYDEMVEICKSAISKFGSAPLADMIRETVKAMVTMHAVNPRLHKVLKEQVPRIGKLKKLNELHKETMRLIKAELLKRSDEISVKDPEFAAFLLVETVDALLHSALVLKRDAWNVDMVVEEITSLLLSYLSRPKQ